MGADGHIRIWKDADVRAAFPDCDELFNYLPTHYADTLDGVLYHHCYNGDNLFVDWDDEDDWYAFGDNAVELKARLRPFCDWLRENGTAWEVWT